MLGHSLRSALVIGVALPLLVQAAGVEIVDISYDPDGADKGREWVRIQNTSGAPLDLTGWKFVEGGVNHGLKALGAAVVPAGGYAIIADDAVTYVAEHTTTDVVFDSSFSLSNTGETVALADQNKVVVASKTYVAEPKPAPAAKTTKKSGSSSKSIPEIKDSELIATPIASAPQAGDWSLWPWLVGLGALVAVGGAALFLVPKRTNSGYEIIDGDG